MKPKTLILMVVAVTCGLGASYMTSRLLAERGTQEVEQEKVTILVAKKNLDMGVVIKMPEDVFQEKKVPKGEEPKGAIVALDQIKGKMLKRSLRADDFISPEDLFSEKDSGLQYVLPPGYRAVGLRVNAEAVAGGFASLPHSRVDIISTVRRGDDRQSYSEVLLEDVLVLAADQQNLRDENNRALLASVVTVALKPDDMVKVNMAKDLGPLSLALRKFDDKKSEKLAKITVEELHNRGQKKEEVVEVTPQAPPPPPVVVEQSKEEPAYKKHRIRFIHGDKVTYSTPYLLDDNGEPIVQEVEVSDPLAEPKAPVVPQPAAANLKAPVTGLPGLPNLPISLPSLLAPRPPAATPQANAPRSPAPANKH